MEKIFQNIVTCNVKSTVLYSYPWEDLSIVGEKFMIVGEISTLALGHMINFNMDHVALLALLCFTHMVVSSFLNT